MIGSSLRTAMAVSALLMGRGAAVPRTTRRPQPAPKPSSNRKALPAEKAQRRRERDNA